MADEDMVDEGGNGGGKGKLIIIIVAVLVLLGVGLAVFFLLTGNGSTGERKAVADISTSLSAEPLEDPQFLPLDPFITNLKEGRRYLKVRMQLMLNEADAKTYLELRIAEVNDVVVAELQKLSLDELNKSNGKEDFKRKLIGKISELFPSDPDWDDPFPIKKVLFEEFYVQ